MAKNSDVGLKQLSNGNWSYRIYINRDGKNIDTTCRVDDNGNPFKTKKAARDARQAKLVELKSAPPKTAEIKRVKLSAVYEKYLKEGAITKAPSTLRKQQSMWDNHVSHEFGNKYIDEITLLDLQNYLAKLYHYGDGRGKEQTYSYKYVEGYLKFFYLLFGCAYKDNLINTDIYTKMFIDKTSRLSMPPITQEDKEDYSKIKVYSKSDIAQLDAIFKRGNCYIAFLCGYYLGLRISEVFALTYTDFDTINHTVTINKQLLYQDGTWCLCPVKTLEAVRKIDVPPFLSRIVAQNMTYQMGRMAAKEDGDYSYRNTEVVIDKTKREHTKIQGGLFINRKENGELLTPNSIKYWAKVIKEELGIEFKFHSLRKTHATMMANLNTPAIELMQRLGHKKYDTTLAYYINSNELARKALINNLKSLEYSAADIIDPSEGIDPFSM